jgi:hypothetical protein
LALRIILPARWEETLINDQMLLAAQEYRLAKSELLARRADQRTDEDCTRALQLARERFEQARLAVREAIHIL